MARALAMHDSLRKFDPDTVIYFLPMDERAEEILIDLNLPRTQTISRLEFFRETGLHKIISQRP